MLIGNSPFILEIAPDYWLNDDALFLLRKLKDGYHLRPRFDLRYLMAPYGSFGYTHRNLVKALEHFDVELKDWEFAREAHQKYHQDPENTFLNRQAKDWSYLKFKTERIVHQSLLSYVTFNTQLDDIDASKLKCFMDDYLENFISGKLPKLSYLNILTFQKHQEILSGFLKEMIEQYGDEFILDELKFKGIDGFFFIHVLLAFELLGFIRIYSLSVFWPEELDSPEPEKYQIHMVVLRRFHEHFPKVRTLTGEKVILDPKEQPDFEYKGIKIFMNKVNPLQFSYAKKADQVLKHPRVRYGDWYVLVRLVKQQGICSSGILIEDVFHEEMTDTSLKKLRDVISRLRNLDISIGNAYSTGYSIDG